MNYLEREAEYFRIVGDLLENPYVLELKKFLHHLDSTRFEHCLNVSRASWRAAKIFGLNPNACARAGLLHDLFFYDYAASGFASEHIYIHPAEALANARKVTELTDCEEDIILRHMWPTCDGVPKYAETYLVSFIDKYCATAEGMTCIWLRCVNAWKRFVPTVASVRR